VSRNAGQSGVRALHVGFDRQTEGRADHASRTRQSPVRDGSRAWPELRRCSLGHHNHLLRHRRPGALPAIDDGGDPVLASVQATSDTQTLVSLIQGQDVTVMQATPATCKMLLDSGWQG